MASASRVNDRPAFLSARFCQIRTAFIILLIFVLAVNTTTALAESKANSKLPPSSATTYSYQIATRKDQLPPAVQTMARALYMAARRGDWQDLRQIIDMNELRPYFGKTFSETDPIATLKALSSSGDGFDLMAQLATSLSMGYAIRRPRAPQKSGTGNVIYLWPYLAGLNLKQLTPARTVDLYRLLPAKQARRDLATGRYSGPLIGIGADGTWHFFQPGHQIAPAP